MAVAPDEILNTADQNDGEGVEKARYYAGQGRIPETNLLLLNRPVGEPSMQAFPPPSLFFERLSEGMRTLAETDMASLPNLSWKMVLVGDLRCRSYRHRP